MPLDTENPNREGTFSSFQEAARDMATFQSGVWLGKITERAKSGLAATATASTIPSATTAVEYALSFVAALVGRHDRTPRILDFGGGMAISYEPLLKAHYRGCCLPPGESLPTDNFDEAHRLTYSSQFIFRQCKAH